MRSSRTCGLIERARAYIAVCALIAAGTSPALAQYAAHQDGDVVRLDDSAHQISVSIAPGVGNVAFQMLVNGQNVLRFPYPDIAAFRSHPNLSGIPLLAPWANRLDEQAFYANGKKYAFNMALGNIRNDAHPMHGFLSFTDKWQVLQVKADRHAAWVTSRLDYYREPSWMAQFPFAQSIEMTYRLSAGTLEVRLKLHNLSSEPMPVAVGFHPFFQLTDSQLEDWTISIGARQQWLLSADKIPTGETQPIERNFPDPQHIVLEDHGLDDVFGDLVRGQDGLAVMTVKGKSQQLQVTFGPKYTTAVVFTSKPGAAATAASSATGSGLQGGSFICFEPMAGITDAMNLAQRGLYHDLQMLPPDQTWEESFWVHPSGF